jgi:LysR family glycine cleavage system transcriptional activator
LYNQSRLNLAELAKTLTSLSNTSDAPLSLTTISSLATKWLLPNLSKYNQKCPGQPLSVLTDDKIIDLNYEGVDAAIRLTNTIDPNMHMSFICDEWVFPVANASLVNADTLMQSPNRLFDYPWLLDVVAEKGDDESSWRGWLASQGMTPPKGHPEQSFNRSDIALQASIAGQGIAIARASLVETDMLDMQLFQQVGKAVKMKYGYYFVCNHDKAEQLEVVNLRHWITKELKRSVEHVKQHLCY